jgi:hypothetical protein
MDASQITDKERNLLLQREIFTPHQRLQHYDLFNYVLDKSGFKSASFPNAESAKKVYYGMEIMYFCNNSFNNLTSVTIQGKVTGSTFNATLFLSLLRNKRMVFYGDSLGRQFYLDLSAELSAFQTHFYYDDDKQVSHSKITRTVELIWLDKYTRRYYADWNVTLMWCEDPKLERIIHRLVVKLKADYMTMLSSVLELGLNLSFNREMRRIIMKIWK